MKLTLSLVGAFLASASAHSDPREGHAGIPKLMGGRKFLAELKARNSLPASLLAPEVQVEKKELAKPVGDEELKIRQLEERQNLDGQCGPGFGACDPSQCCSPAGWCGLGVDYCAAPDCQFLYGAMCDANQIPAGNSTAGIARPQIGEVPYGGAGIYDCVVPGDVAFTFDDGPYNYTSDLLDKLLVYNAKATFMITGNNLGKGPIDSTPEWSNLIKRMIAEGHQIASHTWSHQNLTSLDPTYFNRQIIYNEMAFTNILGYFPTYMRPPYSECNDTCGNILGELGYHVTYFDLDTAGYLNDSPELIQNSKNIWDAAIDGSDNETTNFLEIEHDIHYQTVYNLTDYILASMYAHGYKSVTVGDCLGDPAVNWYRSGNASAPVPPSNPAISEDGSCSASETCLGSVFGDCCSQYGYCGNSSSYCGDGCQPIGGSCGIASSSPSLTESSPLGSSSSSSVSTASSSDVGSIASATFSTKSSFSSFSSSLRSTSRTSSSIKGSITSSATSSAISSSRSSDTTSSTSLKKSSSSTASSKSTSTSSAPKSISTTGKCGGTVTCQGSVYGNCCSQYGYCGSTSAYCSTGCQPSFGTCSALSSSSSKSSTSSKLPSSPKSSTSSKKTTSTSTKKPSSSSTKVSTSSTPSNLSVSLDGTCGANAGHTCTGSTFGTCCSQHGWCGSTTAYCGTGCQSSYGDCS